MIEAPVSEFIVQCRYEHSLEGGVGTVLVGGLPVVTFRSTPEQAGLNIASWTDGAAKDLDSAIRARLYELGVDLGQVAERGGDGG